MDKSIIKAIKENLLLEKKEEKKLFDEIKHISSFGYFNENYFAKEDDYSFYATEADFGKEEDFDEINDKLFTKIKNILLNKADGILYNKQYNKILIVLTDKNNNILIEKIIRISIVLLHDHYQEDYKKLDDFFRPVYHQHVNINTYHEIIRNICKLLLSNNDELKSKIILFYKKTTGNDLKLD
jgi:hypothetical protein